jgi:hypothetical protein
MSRSNIRSLACSPLVYRESPDDDRDGPSQSSSRRQTMKLPAECRFGRMSAAEFYQNGSEWSDCCRAVLPYGLIERDEPLCRSRPECETYRFFWRSSFNGNAAVHVSCMDGSIKLRWRYCRSAVAPQQDSARTLSLADWGKLQDAVSSARFWSIDSTAEEFGFDGATWLIEGRRKDTYHAVERWSPRGAIRDLGRLFFLLSGSPLAELRLT